MTFTLAIPGRAPLSLQAILCDNDGLLVDSEPLALVAWQRTLAPYGVTLTETDLDDMFGLRLDATVRMLLERFTLPTTPEDLASAKNAIMNDLIRTTLQPMPGARDLVAALEERQIPHALATSGLQDHAALCLATVGLGSAFAVRVTGDAVARAKPAPDLFLEAARRLHIAPSACLVLEDAPHGVAAALAAGMAVIAVPNHTTRTLTFPRPTAMATSLIEVLGWLGS